MYLKEKVEVGHQNGAVTRKSNAICNSVRPSVVVPPRFSARTSSQLADGLAAAKTTAF
jgi:hypothetical protein